MQNAKVTQVRRLNELSREQESFVSLFGKLGKLVDNKFVEVEDSFFVFEKESGYLINDVFFKNTFIE